jgi:hypothetical protein
MSLFNSSVGMNSQYNFGMTESMYHFFSSHKAASHSVPHDEEKEGHRPNEHYLSNLNQIMEHNDDHSQVYSKSRKIKNSINQ